MATTTLAKDIPKWTPIRVLAVQMAQFAYQALRDGTTMGNSCYLPWKINQTNETNLKTR